ncbi:MAG: hypothetical protein SNH63_06220 [Rikenellaceae bacterium]
MEIEQFLYDLTEGGEAIVAYTMSGSSGAKVQLCNMGASVLSLTLASGRDIASGRCVMGLEGLLGLDPKGNGEPFDERLWESWVETNRVIMSTAVSHRGVDLTMEVVFDFDDDDTFEITYQAYAAEDVEFDLTHALSIDMGSDMEVAVSGTQLEDRDVYAIDGSRASILTHVAHLTSAMGNVEVCSSQPQLYHSSERKIISPVSGLTPHLAANHRYIHKSLFRLG